MRESSDMRGQLTVQLTDRDGRIVREQRHHNRIVRSGRQLVAQLFGGTTQGVPPSRVTHLAIGTSGAAPADDQTALGAERSPRKPITELLYSDIDEPVPGGGGTTVRRVKASLKAVYDFGEGNDPATPLREAGIFTAETAGVMYNRVVFNDVTKTDAFKLTLLWDIIF
jgi:hypothetical protein